MKIVIIEDELLTAKDLANTIMSIEPQAIILPFIQSVEAGIAFFEFTPEIDLIFSDIELGDGLSFDIFKKSPPNTPIIFCTAYQQYALEAFAAQGIDYILKPFNAVHIERTFKKIRMLRSNLSKVTYDFEVLKDQVYQKKEGELTSIIIKKGGKFIPIRIEEIALFFIENGNVYAYTFDKKKYVLSQKLDELEIMFPSFFRSNRQTLLNRAVVKEATKYFHRKLLIRLNIPFKEPVIVGKMKVNAFLKWLQEA
jgi:DNA-binding LytR/AlgR family response regulator